MSTALQTIKENQRRQEDILIDIISEKLLPLVEPYDLSETSRRFQYNNNPYFRSSVMAIFHLIKSRPLTMDASAFFLEGWMEGMRAAARVCKANAATGNEEGWTDSVSKDCMNLILDAMTPRDESPNAELSDAGGPRHPNLRTGSARLHSLQ